MALKRAANGYDYYVPETEWDVLPEQQRQRRRVERHVQKERVEVTYEVHPSQLARRKNAIANCLTAAAVFVMLIAVLFGYSAISTINLENIEIEENIDNLKTQAEGLELGLSAQSDIKDVAERAEAQNMGFPENGQIRYVALGATETEEAPSQEQTQEGQEEGNFFTDLWNYIAGN